MQSSIAGRTPARFSGDEKATKKQKKDEDTILKKVRLMMIGILLVVSSGCIFIPEDGDQRGHEDHHDRGDHRNHDREEHKDRY
jgi:hypothetical protein